MKLTPVRKSLLIGLPIGMLIGIAGTVLAADPRLDDANGHVDQAIALLTAADNPARDKGDFGGHRKRAIDLLNQVKKEITKAKEFQDKDGGAPPPHKDGGKGGGKGDGKPAPKPTTEPKPKK
ncbi:MAG TPA: hypothetical protein VF103_13610 [Polyangiaceae bacterium]